MFLRVSLRKVFGYSSKQISEINQGGIKVLLRKVKSKTITLICVSIAMPFIFVVRLLSPYLIIRFGKLHGDRIGHFGMNTAIYIYEKDSGLHKGKWDIFYVAEPVSNKQLKKMWERNLTISKFVRYLNIANFCLPGYKKHQISTKRELDLNNVFSIKKTLLSFTDQEKRYGEQGLKEMNIPEDSPFVCLIGRESAYLNSWFSDERNWNYHNYRDMNIKNFAPAAKELTKRGYFVIRMGSVVNQSLSINEPKFVDYATKFRTDFLDIYLSSKCVFFVNGMAGFASVPRLFHRPVVHVNFIPIQKYGPTDSNELIIPKKLWHIKDRRFITFREIFGTGIGRIVETEKYINAGIEPIENTPEEISAIVNEMEERIRGEWETTDDDDELQRRFNSLYNAHKTVHEPNGRIRIGTMFLRQNIELLE